MVADLQLLAPLGKSLLGAVRLSAKLVAIIVPLVTVFELLRHVPFFRRAGDAAEPLVGKVGLSRDATVPLFTGIFLGIAYGAGIIIRVSREKGLSDRERFLLGLFLATCHAVVEDTFIFAAVGGSFAAMLGVRFVLAVALTSLAARLLRRRGGALPSSSPGW